MVIVAVGSSNARPSGIGQGDRLCHAGGQWYGKVNIPCHVHDAALKGAAGPYIFFWTYIPGLVAWLEALRWLIMSDVEWARQYGGEVRRSNGLALGCLWIFALLPLLAILSVLALLVLGGGIAAITSEI